GFDFPELNATPPGGGQRLAVRRKSDRKAAPAAAPAEHELDDLLGLCAISDLVSFPGNLRGGRHRLEEAANFLAACEIPQADGVVPPGREQRLAVRPEADEGDVGPVTPAGRPQTGEGASGQRVAGGVRARLALDLGTGFG